MKMTSRFIVGIYVTLLCTASTYAGFSLEVSTQPGWDIYTPESAGYRYRYGPSIIINPSGSINIWTAAPPEGTGWDTIRYKKSTDGGLTWSTESVALSPTSGSSDARSVCDPAVVYFGGYYYMGYTSTQNSKGLENEVYVARSRYPDRGFEKWNGSGWGGNPQPFIEFTGLSTSWGAGEPSFVVKDGTLLVYYTWLDATRTTRVASVSASDPNWPANLTYLGTAAVNNSNGSSSTQEDSMDVKYIDEYEKFIGVTVNNRFSADSCIRIWESDDGLIFTPSSEITLNTQDWAHNAGISGGLDGHINLNANNFIAYAYSPNNGVTWGNWATYLNPITISNVPEPGMVSMLGTGIFALFLLLKRRGKTK